MRQAIRTSAAVYRDDRRERLMSTVRVLVALAVTLCVCVALSLGISALIQAADSTVIPRINRTIIQPIVTGWHGDYPASPAT